MPTKRELEDQAKAFIENSPIEAVDLYRTIWNEYPAEFNHWDALNTIKTMRRSDNPDLNWAYELVQKFQDISINNIYAWLIFDKCVKGKSSDELKSNENIILKLSEISPQNDRSQDDTFPCATTISFLNLANEYSRPSFNAQKVNNILKKLNPEYLSSKHQIPKPPNDEEYPSDYEKYASLKTKALFKLGNYTECIDFCKKALSKIDKCHYNNDTWFKMRIALSEDKLGNHNISENLLQELLNSRAGADKWFLYQYISEVYFEQGDYSKAWKYSVDGALHGNEPHFLINLYLLQARILLKLNRSDEGKILAELIAAIFKEQHWRDKIEYTRLFDYYKLNRNSLPSFSEIMNNAKQYWTNEKYKGLSKLKGKIVSLHNNGKIGRIKIDNGNIIPFHKKDFAQKIKSLDKMLNAVVEFYVMDSFEGRKVAENIVVLEMSNKEKHQISVNKELIGKTFEGIVQGVVDYGIFVSIPDSPKCLLHKNNMNDALKDNFKNEMNKGMKIRVKVEEITEKGVKLSLI